jgi:hypothetical protein
MMVKEGGRGKGDTEETKDTEDTEETWEAEEAGVRGLGKVLCPTRRTKGEGRKEERK